MTFNVTMLHGVLDTKVVMYHHDNTVGFENLLNL